MKLISQTIIQDNIDIKSIKLESVGIMRLYSTYKGKYSEYFKRYEYQKLPGDKKSSIEKCKSILDILNKISRNQTS